MPHYVYILSNSTGTVLSTGVTPRLKGTVEQHRVLNGAESAKDYTPNLVYFEAWDDEARARERLRLIDSLSWLHKTGLINRDNELWTDLYYELA